MSQKVRMSSVDSAVRVSNEKAVSKEGGVRPLGLSGQDKGWEQSQPSFCTQFYFRCTLHYTGQVGGWWEVGREGTKAATFLHLLVLWTVFPRQHFLANVVHPKGEGLNRSRKQGAWSEAGTGPGGLNTIPAGGWALVRWLLGARRPGKNGNGGSSGVSGGVPHSLF